MMDDLISRTAAIDALGERPYNWTDTDAEIAEMSVWEMHKAAIENVPAVDAAPVVRCKDCKYFETKDIWADFGKVPILVSDVPTCHRWEGECKTSPDGYCFLGKRRKEDAAD